MNRTKTIPEALPVDPFEDTQPVELPGRRTARPANDTTLLPSDGLPAPRGEHKPRRQGPNLRGAYVCDPQADELRNMCARKGVTLASITLRTGYTAKQLDGLDSGRWHLLAPDWDRILAAARAEIAERVEIEAKRATASGEAIVAAWAARITGYRAAWHVALSYHAHIGEVDASVQEGCRNATLARLGEFASVRDPSAFLEAASSHLRSA